jgi:hypothetical protein
LLAQESYLAVAQFEISIPPQNRTKRPSQTLLCGGNPMEHRGVEYSVVQLPEGNRWRWEVRFDDGKTKTGVTPVSRAVAITQAKSAIDHFLRDTK